MEAEEKADREAFLLRWVRAQLGGAHATLQPRPMVTQESLVCAFMVSNLLTT